MRAVRLLVIAALALGSGCSALVAAIARDHDMSVLRVGATREAVERKLGRPSETYGESAAVYDVRVGQKSTAGENALTVGRVGVEVMGEAAKGGDCLGLLLGAILAVPAMVGTDVYLGIREIASVGKRRRRLTVFYDARGRVASWDLADRPPPKKSRSSRPPEVRVEEDLEKKWKRVRGRYR